VTRISSFLFDNWEILNKNIIEQIDRPLDFNKPASDQAINCGLFAPPWNKKHWNRYQISV